MSGLTVLVLDDEERLAGELAEYLEAGGHRAHIAGKPSEAFLLLEGHAVDVAIVDIKLPEYDGLEFLRRLKDRYPAVETIVMSGHGDMDRVIEAFRLGAFDYLRKPFGSFDLQAALGRTNKYLLARRESRRYAELCASLSAELSREGELIGSSQAMETVRDRIALAASESEAPVLISGESGTGKELVARRIHALSPRAYGRFVAVNCAAVPRDMFESEFFGHERGSFTDARNAREGLFRSADGGTLFLDEVGEVPLELQAKLLRAIEEKAVRPVGSDTERRADVRILAATNKNLSEAVAERTFRGDLYYRLAVIELTLPPLRDRGEDVIELAEHFYSRFAGTAAEPLPGHFGAQLLRYSFPGNVRELKNLMERASISRKTGLPFEFPDIPVIVAADTALWDGEGELRLDILERRAIEEALRRSAGVHAAAARLLGITRQALSRRLERHGL